MITSGSIQNTHYNIVDTLKLFMGEDWNKSYAVIKNILETIDVHKYLECIGPCPYPFIDKGLISLVSDSEACRENLQYENPVRYTIVETIVWCYINFEMK